MVIHWEMLLVEGGAAGGATPENLQNVHLHTPYLDVVFTRSPDVNQNNAITSSTVGFVFFTLMPTVMHKLTDISLVTAHLFFLEQV